MAKWMWIIAGPNGAGKSTFTNEFLDTIGHGGLTKLNADERTLVLRQQNPGAARDDLNLQAAIDIDQQVADHIASGKSFVVETVLSSDKYRDDVLAAKAAGFQIGLIYVSLYPPKLSAQRVSERAAKGGHDVEPAKAIARHRRSHEQLRWFAPHADVLFVFDNSAVDAKPVVVAVKTQTTPFHIAAPGVNPAVDRALAPPRKRAARPKPQNG